MPIVRQHAERVADPGIPVHNSPAPPDRVPRPLSSAFPHNEPKRRNVLDFA